MSVNFTDKEQNSIALMNVSYYGSKADYMADTFSDVSEETGVADFHDQMERGFIQEITCGTYNGATDDFTPWQLNDNNNILDTIYNHINDIDFFNDDIFMASYLPEEHEEIKKWSNADWVREYTEVYEVFIIGDSVYVNQD